MSTNESLVTDSDHADDNPPHSVWIWFLAGSYFAILSYQIDVPLIQSKYDPGPAFLPRILGFGLLLAGCSQLLTRLIRREPLVGQRSHHFSLLLSGLVIAYIVTLPHIGFHLTTFSFSIVSMKLFHIRWSIALACTTIMVALVHLVFFELFAIPLPQIY